MGQHNKTALVRGFRGIGRPLRWAAETGAHVLVHYGRSAPEAESLVSEIQTKGGSANEISVDLGTPTRCAASETGALNRRRSIVLNAGISKTHRGLHVEDFDNLFATNVRSPFFWYSNSCQFLVSAQTSFLSLPLQPVRWWAAGLENLRSLPTPLQREQLRLWLNTGPPFSGRAHTRKCRCTRSNRHGHVEFCETEANRNRKTGRCSRVLASTRRWITGAVSLSMVVRSFN